MILTFGFGMVGISWADPGGGQGAMAPPQSANIIKGFEPHIDNRPITRQYVAPPNPKSWIRPCL